MTEDKEVTTAIGLAARVTDKFGDKGTTVLIMFLFIALLSVHAVWSEYRTYQREVRQQKELAVVNAKCDSLSNAFIRHINNQNLDNIKVIEKNNNLLERIERRLDRGILASNLDK
jgi:hypothetical protein